MTISAYSSVGHHVNSSKDHQAVNTSQNPEGVKFQSISQSSIEIGIRMNRIPVEVEQFVDKGSVVKLKA